MGNLYIYIYIYYVDERSMFILGHSRMGNLYIYIYIVYVDERYLIFSCVS